MKNLQIHRIILSIFTFLTLSTSEQLFAQGIPELMYYRFNTPGPVVQNESPISTLVGSASPSITGSSLTIGSSGLTGTALTGTGGATTDFIATGWNTNLVSTDWTLSFWMNNFPSGTTLWYLFGDAGNSFRCFVNGAPGAGNIRLTGTGLPTVDVTAVTGSVNVLHFVRTTLPNEIKAYKNGVLFSTTAITGTLTVGTGFRIGSYTSGSAISGQLDEFRMYNRALSATEITNTWNRTLGAKGGNDASISQLVSAPKFCGTTQDLRVKVANRGLNTISNVMINWAIDGLSQTPISLVTLLDTVGHPTNKNDTNITLGTITYTPNITKRIDVWTSMPNGVTDTITNNDSLLVFLRPGLNGTYTIASTSADFTSPRSAINTIDSFGRCGPLIFNVTAGEVFTSTPLVLSNLDSITFQKFGVGANPIVYGVRGTGTTDAVFRIGGSKKIVFDGIDVADSISNAANPERMEYGYSIVNSSATNGSSNNIIRNCKITLNRANTASFGIVQSTTATAGGVVATSLAGGNHNNRYENVKIENTYKGIGLIGTAAFPDSNCIVTSANGDTSIIGANTSNDIGNGTVLVYGINAADQKNVEISKCIVRNLAHTGTSTNQGIFIDNGSTTVDYGIARVWGNTVFNINRTTSTSATGTVHGIRIDVSSTAAARIWNNVVYNINNLATIATATANQMVRGISQGTTTGTGNAEYYHNSVSISPSNAGLNNSSVAFWKGGTGIANVRNNIFSNASPAQTGVSKHYATYLNAGSIVASNNVYWSPNVNGFVGFAASDRTTLSSFAAATSALAPSNGNEQGSANANPNFISATNLDFLTATPAAISGMPITAPFAITTDILGNTRSTLAPSIGAYETTQTLFDSAAPIITNVFASSGTAPLVFATVQDNSGASSAGNIQLWYRLGNSGPFTAVAPDSIPVGSINGTYKWGSSLSSIVTGSYQYFIAVRDQVGSGLNVSVNPIQAGTFTSFSSTDPVNYVNNPDASVNVRNFAKTAVLAGGVYAVGALSAPYFKLTDVANILNSSELTGNVIFELQSNYDGTVGETFPIIFNPTITTGGNWTVTIRPAIGVVSRETSGYPSSAVPIIDLNGIDRIIFDGRPGGVGTNSEWTIRSKRNTVSSNSPCIQVDNGAQRNLLNYLKVESDNTTTTSGAIFISNTSNSDGNSFNRITNCIITGRTDSIGVPAVIIYSAGTTGFTNDSNIITNNDMVNWTTSGVQVTSTGNGANWQINNNHFYMTAARTTAQTAIRFEAGTLANGTRINGNFIGGSLPNAAGAAWTNSVAGIWRGIVCAASTTDSVQIQNNTIQNISLTGGAGTYAGIEMTGALASIRNNTIGHPSTANSIQTSQLGTIISIWLNNATNQALIEGNLIANINSTGTTTAVGHNGIRIITGVTTAPLVIRNNSIYNLSAANLTATSTTASMIGILSLYAGTLQTIERNTIYGLRNSANSATSVLGINVSNTSGIGTINANTIYDLNNTSATAAAQVVGIHLDLGSSWNVTNNMVSLGTGIDSLAIVTGIQDKTAGTNHTISNNTVLISGTAISSAATLSHAFRRTTVAVTNIRNNIFQNVRTGGTANYAIANSNASPATGWSANFNALHTSNAAQLGLWNATATDFATWKTTSLFDTSSINTAASFVSLTDLHLTVPTIGDVTFAGRPIAGLLLDFDGQNRDLFKPYMGADEIPSSPLPVKLVSFNAQKSGTSVLVTWATSSEINADNFIVEFSNNGKDFEPVGRVKAKGNSSTLVNYKNSHNDVVNMLKGSSIAYYRLKIIDKDGFTEMTKAAIVYFSNENTKSTLNVYPNPFNEILNVSIDNNIGSGLAQIRIFDIKGSVLVEQSKSIVEGQNTISIKELKGFGEGLYFVQVQWQGKMQTLKILKN